MGKDLNRHVLQGLHPADFSVGLMARSHVGHDLHFRPADTWYLLLLPTVLETSTRLSAPALASSKDSGSPDPLGGMWSGPDAVSNKETSL